MEGRVMKLKRVGVGSLARIAALLYGIIGIIVGGIIAVISVLGTAFSREASSGPYGVFFGVGAVLILPPLYAFVGGIMAALVAGIYNALARMMGGIEVVLE